MPENSLANDRGRIVRAMPYTSLSVKLPWCLMFLSTFRLRTLRAATAAASAHKPQQQLTRQQKQKPGTYGSFNARMTKQAADGTTSTSQLRFAIEILHVTCARERVVLSASSFVSSKFS